MLKVFTDTPKQTNFTLTDSLSLLQEFQTQLLLSQTHSSQLALQEVQDCISELQIEQTSPLSTSLNLAWLIREIENLLETQRLTLTKLETESWTAIKQLCHTS